jgi:hypothetical protein
LEAKSNTGSVEVGAKSPLTARRKGDSLILMDDACRWTIPLLVKCWKYANASGACATGSFIFPMNSRTMDAAEASMAYSYKFSHLSYIRQALLYSTKTSLRTDSSGIISMQFMIVNANAPSGNDTSGVGFVEFTVSYLQPQRNLPAREADAC